MGQMLVQPLVVEAGAFLVVGIKTRTTHRIEAIAHTARIPALWRKFAAESVSAKLRDRVADPTVIGVYSEYKDADRGPYSLLIGHKVRTLDDPPPGMSGVAVPAGRYLLVTATGSIAEPPFAAWQEINRLFALSHEFERGYTIDYEVHHSDSAEIYVALR
jgi:predicted transcriptional regulator YdeE